MFAMMTHLCFVYFCFTVSFSLRILKLPADCTQPGLDNCSIGNCSEPIKVKRLNAPTIPEWGPDVTSVVLERDRFIPVLNVSWRIHATDSISTLRGSQIHVRDEKNNQTLCFEYSYNLVKTLNPVYEKWTFSLDGVVVQPEHSYKVSVNNIPEPNSGNHRIMKTISIPGCDDKIIKDVQECRENGSLWQPSTTTKPSLDWKQKIVFIVVRFCTSEFSEKYDVFLQSPGVSSFKSVLKENRTLLNVTFELSLSQFQRCEIVIKIQPFFKQCNDRCWSLEEPFEDCSFGSPRTLIVKNVFGVVIFSACLTLAYLLRRTFVTAPTAMPPQFADDATPQCTQMAQRKRLLIIYSLDHPLYKNIVLKLCSFLMAKCGTEVVLDMLDSTRLGMLGGIQWLEWHRQQIETSSDKILILCSRGVQAKWRAMCTGERVQLREDALSTVGDMLVPALCLMVPNFVKATSFEKYIVAYFDDVSTEDDVPLPFNITVRYRLMKQFEELFFRILDCEKHEMGKVNRIEGLSEDEYHLCPTGRALRNAIEDFHAYQVEHPQWFEEELIDMSETDIDSDLVPDSVFQDKPGHIARLSDCAPDTATVPLSEQQVQLSVL